MSQEELGQKRFVQAPLLENTRPLNFTSETLKPDAPSVYAYLDALRKNSDITRVSYVTYDPSIDNYYEGLAKNPQGWIAKSLATEENLRRISSLTCDATEKYIQTDHDEALIVRDGIAMASQVKILGGETMHVPMLDFTEGVWYLDDEEMDDLITDLQLGPGYLINSGYGAHYVGLNLLDDEEWRRSLVNTEKINDEWFGNGYEKMVDDGFVTASLERGFSALRMFAYPPEKPDEPKISSVIR